MANLLASATRTRSLSSTTPPLPQPPEPQYTNHPQAPPTPSRTRNRPSSWHSGVFSTSAPSIAIPFDSHMRDRYLSSGSVASPHSSESPQPSIPAETALTIEFEGGTHVILRPNRTVRGKVILDAANRTMLTRIRIRFRAEESAMVKVEEGGADNEWIHRIITVFFEADWKLWGNDASIYSQSPWDDLEAGHYEFPFALKFPNVNYPPSAEEPQGFTIRYVWSAQADGPALEAGLKSREYITPYRPIILSTADKEWVYRATLMKDKKHPLAEVQTKLNKQSYCPDEPFEMQLKLMPLQADSKVSAIDYMFRKYHEGKMLVQQGTAFRKYVRTVFRGSVPITHSTDNQISETVRFDVPKRLVSPSFTTRHTRVRYDLQFIITIEHGHHLFRINNVVDFAIPLVIANLPHDNLLRIPDLVSIKGYRDNNECPIFFDPSLDEPPDTSQPTLVMATPPVNEDPPNYFSLQEQPPQPEHRKERKERTVFLTRPAKGAGHGHEILPAIVVPGLFDEQW